MLSLAHALFCAYLHHDKDKPCVLVEQDGTENGSSLIKKSIFAGGFKQPQKA